MSVVPSSYQGGVTGSAEDQPISGVVRGHGLPYAASVTEHDHGTPPPADDGYWEMLAGEAGDGPGPASAPPPRQAPLIPPREPVNIDEAELFAQLRDTFGYESFRDGQLVVIAAALAAQDCLAVMPTGSGKSSTYQLSARLLGGTTLVISPLIALMKDQVDAATELGIAATFINSSIEWDERQRRIEGLQRGDYELVYVAPEGLGASLGSVLDDSNVRLVALHRLPLHASRGRHRSFRQEIRCT
jgi:superfamily II DNA helicase RecQ